jgi:threonine/homoserine/homoserine lactone efflux protein
MESSIAFAAAATALLLVPGPTNSLIATNGAISGLSPTIRLLPAEVCGYMLSIVGWGLGLSAVVATVPSAGLVAKFVACAILIHSARDLWFVKSAADERRWTNLRDIFLVTLSNPKGLIFALTIVPYLKDGNIRSAVPYLAGLAVLILTIGCGWAAAGAGLASSLSAAVSTAAIARVGAVVMLGFAVGLCGTTLAAMAF